MVWFESAIAVLIRTFLLKNWRVALVMAALVLIVGGVFLTIQIQASTDRAKQLEEHISRLLDLTDRAASEAQALSDIERTHQAFAYLRGTGGFMRAELPGTINSIESSARSGLSLASKFDAELETLWPTGLTSEKAYNAKLDRINSIGLSVDSLLRALPELKRERTEAIEQLGEYLQEHLKQQLAFGYDQLRELISRLERCKSLSETHQSIPENEELLANTLRQGACASGELFRIQSLAEPFPDHLTTTDELIIAIERRDSLGLGPGVKHFKEWQEANGPFLSGPAASFSGSQRYDVTAKALNVRPDPSTSYYPIASAIKGETVSVLDRSRSLWWKVQTKDGIIGWVSSRYLTLSN